MIDQNWSRWVRASARKHFDDRKQDLYLHFEGMDRDKLKSLVKYVEFRIDGPSITELSHNYYRLDVAINIAITNKINDTDLDTLVRMAGIVQVAFTPTIEVLRLGIAELDTGDTLGCLQSLDKIRFNNFGVVDEILRLEQATVEGRYRLYLTGN